MEIGDGGLSIPILASKVSAGPGQEWLPEDFRTDERLPILERFIRPYSIDKIFAAEVKGDSMTGIQLFDGDFVFAVKGYIDGDGVYVIAIAGETYVKRVEQDPVDKKLRIISENTRYQPRVVDVDQVVVLGKVIGWLHHHPYCYEHCCPVWDEENKKAFVRCAILA
jgi:phage repressor protein C with HTH and peptisase S24 domain